MKYNFCTFQKCGVVGVVGVVTLANQGIPVGSRCGRGVVRCSQGVVRCSQLHLATTPFLAKNTSIYKGYYTYYTFLMFFVQALSLS